MFLYQETSEYFAQIAGGMEDMGCVELSALGATSVRPSYRGAWFHATPEALYTINYRSRLLTRVLAPLKTFACRDDSALYKRAGEIPWHQLFGQEKTFAIHGSVANSSITHSQFATLRMKDAIVDSFRRSTGGRPTVNRLRPDYQLTLRIENDLATISMDTSGLPLHKRGYRQKSVEAPMQETLAAAIVQLSGWDGQTRLYDPFCGSGTILCEALMQYCHLPAGYLRRRFGFQGLPDYDDALWRRIRKECDSARRDLPEGLIFGSDFAEPALAASRENCQKLPGGGQIDLRLGHYNSRQDLAGVTIICNPPYGLRLQTQDNMPAFYKALGDFLKQKCQGSSAYIYFGNRQLIGSLGLRTSWKRPLVNGALDGRLVKIDLY